MRGVNKVCLKDRALGCLFLWFFALALGGSGVAFAQDDASGEFMLEEIVVTGSRIVRNNNASASPIVTVDEKLINNSSTLSIETQLNKLPQFTPTADLPTNGGDVQPTARSTPGEATVALRGLGANRTLVLINGRRGTPSNAMGVLDINTIPSAAIEYVEAISGGASSTYGADAISGVLNFIMKDHFEGLQLDAQAGITQEGDNFEHQISAVMGANFADDRGNIMVAFSYNNREAAMQKDRSWYRDMWADPSITSTAFFSRSTGAALLGNNLPDPDVINAVMEIPEDQRLTAAPTSATYYTHGDQVFAGFDLNNGFGIPAAQDLGIVDGYSVKLTNNVRLGANDTEAYLIFPLTRWNSFTNGSYEINDRLSVFGQAYYSSVETQTQAYPSPSVAGWRVDIYPEYNRDAIPTELLAILDSRPDPNAPFFVKATLPDYRETVTSTQTLNMTLGLEGEIPGIGWTWEAFTSHGEALTYAASTGNASLERFRSVVSGVAGYNEDGTPYFYDGYHNFGEGFKKTGNDLDNGFGAPTATCTSGLNPFDWSSMTPDCWDAVRADVKSRMIMVQDIWQINTQGRILDLPAGELRGSLGYSTRTNDFKFLADTINSDLTSFNDQILGSYPAADSYGSITADEAYAEFLVPLIKDVPFIKQLNLELGGRRSEYDVSGTSYTYKALLDWQTTDYLRFRGGYNRAERAPNIAELYLNPEMIFDYLNYGDVCSMRNSVAPTTADPSTNPEWYEVVKICGQLMEKYGQDADKLNFYGADWEDIHAYGVANPGATAEQMIADGLFPESFYSTGRQLPGGSSYYRPVNVGNPNLKPEKADTWTVGFVLDSFVRDIPALTDWRISVDYYSIKVEDAIGDQSGDLVMLKCVNPAFNPTYDVNSPFCQGLTRTAAYGDMDQVKKSFYNDGAFKTSGIDIQINWGMDLGGGRLNVNSLVNYLIEKKSTELAGFFPMVDYVGTFGPTENGLNGNSYEWRALTNVNYAWGDIDLTLRWQWWDSIEQAAAARGFNVQTGAPSYSLFDLFGNYQLYKNVQIRFGIENLFNEEPPLQNRYIEDPGSGMFGGSYDAVNNDTNGRRFYMGARMTF